MSDGSVELVTCSPDNYWTMIQKNWDVIQSPNEWTTWNRSKCCENAKQQCIRFKPEWLILLKNSADVRMANDIIGIDSFSIVEFVQISTDLFTVIDWRCWIRPAHILWSRKKRRRHQRTHFGVGLLIDEKDFYRRIYWACHFSLIIHLVERRRGCLFQQ